MKWGDDLFDYPDGPGFKEKGGTSEAAARRIAPMTSSLRGKALAILRDIYPQGLSADQVASRCGVSILSMRPRITELYQMGWIEKTQGTTKNGSGVDARIWRFRP